MKDWSDSLWARSIIFNSFPLGLSYLIFDITFSSTFHHTQYRGHIHSSTSLHSTLYQVTYSIEARLALLLWKTWESGHHYPVNFVISIDLSNYRQTLLPRLKTSGVCQMCEWLFTVTLTSVLSNSVIPVTFSCAYFENRCMIGARYLYFVTKSHYWCLNIDVGWSLGVSGQIVGS